MGSSELTPKRMSQPRQAEGEHSCSPSIAHDPIAERLAWWLLVDVTSAAILLDPPGGGPISTTV